MIFSLSWKNFKAQFINYLVYFISMTFAVVVYYCFRAITYDQLLVSRAAQDVQIKGAMNIGGFLIIVMILGFMFAANHFFLLQRNKEIGLYHLIGMRKAKISLLFFIETLILGGISLIAGLILGLVFSKLFSMILAKAMFLNVESLFRFSMPAIEQTTLAFLLMLLVVTLQSTWTIYRYKMNQLSAQNKPKSGIRKRMTLFQGIMGLFGIVLPLMGYILSVHLLSFSYFLMKHGFGASAFLVVPLFIMCLCILGTYFFFKFTLPLSAFVFGKNKKTYYRNMNMLAIENAKQHIRKNGKTLFSITIFIAVALSMIGGATSFYTLGMNSVNTISPTDFIVADNQFAEMETIIANESDTAIDQVVPLTYKLTGSSYELKIGRDREETKVNPINILSLSDYQAYQKINPYLKDVKIKTAQEVVLLDNFRNILGGYLQYGSSITIQGLATPLTITERRQDFLGDDAMRYGSVTIIVSNELYAQIHTGITYTLMAFNVASMYQEQLTDQISEKLNFDWVNPVSFHYQRTNGQIEGTIAKSKRQEGTEVNSQSQATNESEFWQLNYTNRFLNLRYERRMMGLFIYVALFLGIVALIITGSILMLQQLSEAEKEKESYALLRKIGIPEKEIMKLVYQQNSLVFFPPMILGGLHATFAIVVFSTYVSSSGYWLAYVSCGLLILIYLAYYILTSVIYCRIIQKNKTK